MSRTRKALINTIFEIFREVITAVCGLILPRLILSHFGSMYNGVTQSITQFISCVALLKSGIGSVTRAALYVPLAQDDTDGISEVVNATEQFMRRVALIFLGSVLLFAAIYPVFVLDYFDWFTIASLVLILSLSTFAQYYFGITYQMVLQADQRNYIISAVQIASVVINTAVASFMISMGCSIHLVKLGSAIVYIFPPVFYLFYTRRRYHIDKKITPNFALISQRWDAFGHQFANFINDNTDVILITLLLGVKEVSLYTIYYMIVHNIRVLVMAFSTGTQGAFGNMIAKKENTNLRIKFEQFELMMYIITTIMYITTFLLIIPFVRLYTKGINDLNYINVSFAALICLAHYFECIKAPYSLLIFTNGSFKETKRDSYIEAVINIVLSITLALIIGINGIIIGTLCAAIYRVIRYNCYVSRCLLNKLSIGILRFFVYSAICCGLCYYITNAFAPKIIESYIQWAFWGAGVLLLVCIISMVVSYIFFRKRFIMLFNTLIGVFKQKIR